jgi:hypothetical protein
MNFRKEKPLLNFEKTARHFCTLLESAPPDSKRWIKDVLVSLAELYAAALQIPEYDLPENSVEVPDSFRLQRDERAVIRKRVGTILGEKSAYWTYFNPTIINDPKEEPIAGALWDDLEDIYGDIKPGLKAWYTNRDEYLPHIAFDWRFNFEFHSGHHAVNAMRAFHPMAFEHSA